MAFLKDECVRVPLSERIVSACEPFSCGNKDLDEFFSSDYLDYARQLMGKTYVFLEVANPRQMFFDLMQITPAMQEPSVGA